MIARGEYLRLLLSKISVEPAAPVLALGIGVPLFKLSANRRSVLVGAWLQQLRTCRDAAVLVNAAQILGNYENRKIERWLKSALSRSPESADLHRALAVVLRKGIRHNGPGARRRFREAYEHSLAAFQGLPSRGKESSAMFLLNLAKYAWDAQLWDAAHEWALRAVKALQGNQWKTRFKRFPGLVLHESWTIVGLCLLKEGDVNGAISVLAKSVARGTRGWVSAFGPDLRLAKALAESGAIAPVIIFLSKCEVVWPDRAKTFQLLAQNVAASKRGSY